MLGLRKRNINMQKIVTIGQRVWPNRGRYKMQNAWSKTETSIHSVNNYYIYNFSLRLQGLRLLKINSLHDLLLGPIQHQDKLSATVHDCYLYMSMFPIWRHPRHCQVTLTIPFWVRLGQFVGRKMSNVFSVTSVVAVNKVHEQ